MKKLFTAVIISVICTVIFAQAKAPNDGQVFYYKQTGVVKNNTKTAGDNTGQFISFTFAGCYDSNNQKYDVGNGFLAYKGLQNNIHAYSGRSYWGENSNYYFTADFNKLNVYAPDGIIYVYEKNPAPAGVVTCAKIYVKPEPKPSQNDRVVTIERDPVYPVNPVNPVRPVVPDNKWQAPPPPPPPAKTKCYTCGGSGNCKNCRGTGNCTSCRGTGLVRNIKPDGDLYYNCAVCSGSGKCGWCYGSGKCQGCRGTGYL